MKSKSHLPRLLLVFIVFTFATLFSYSLMAEEQQTTSPEQSAVATEEQKTTLITIYSWATILPKELIDLQNQITKEKKVRSIEENLPNLSAEIDTIRWDTTIAQTSPEIQDFQVTNLQERTQRFEARLNKITVPINNLISQLSKNRKQWLTKKDLIVSIANRRRSPSF